MRTAALLLAFALALPAAAVPQSGPVHQPGGVATVVVDASGAEGSDSLAWSVTPADGVRLFAARAGRAASPPGAPVRIPLTFGVPSDASAGDVLLATVELRHASGAVESREVVVQVASRRGVDFWLATESMTAAAGSYTEIGYRLRNLGNATDTFRIDVSTPSGWPAVAIPPVRVVAAGDTAAGVIRVTLPGEARRGQEHHVRVDLRGVESRMSRSARLVVVGEESRFGGLTTVPGAIFVGSSTGTESALPGVALTAGGEVRPGTRVSLAVRHVDGLVPPAAFRNTLSGPRLQLAADGVGWRARAGDVFTGEELVTGPSNHGRGVAGGATVGAVSFDAHAALPWSYMGMREDGHVLRGGAALRTGLGTFAVRAGSVHREGSLIGTHSQAGATVGYALRTSNQSFEAEAGLMRVADDSASVMGPTALVRYMVDHGPLTVSARLRTVPGTTVRTVSHGQEAFLSATYRLSPVLSAMGWAYANDAPPVGAGAHLESDGVSGGFRIGLPTGIQTRVMGSYRSSRMRGSDHPGSATRSMRFGVNLPVRPVMLEGDVNVGVRTGAVDHAYSSARAGARWGSAGQWGWLGLSYNDAGFGRANTSLDLNGSVMVGDVEIQGGLNSLLTAPAPLHATSFWSAVSVPVTRGTSLSLGAEHRAGYIESPWRVSVGLTRGLGVPLPLPRQTTLHGVVFEDRDGDGIRGPGDVVIDGARVVFGALQARTGADGAFRFHDDGRGAVTLDPASLPAGFVLPAGTVLPTSGYVEIPVIRTGSLRVRVFLDRDDDGVFHEGDDAPAVGAVVTLVDRAGLPRDAAANRDGVVRFGSLTPGTYRVIVHRPGSGARNGINGRGQGPVEMDVLIGSGEDAELVVALPMRALEVRLPGGGLLQR